jgi:hypothetical protein
MLSAAAAADAVVHVDQVPAVAACIRRKLAAQERLYSCRAYLFGIRRKIDAVAFAVSLAEHLHPLARSIRAIRAGEQPAFRNARAHNALLLIVVRRALPRAAAGARLLAEVPVAKHAVQPAGSKHVDVDGIRRKHAFVLLYLFIGTAAICEDS